ncbi:hypothetical protein ASL83_003331 [Vibrio parahaemolyticus]|nr:hypothetical protein [Vibrio parahaemolyticus]
MALSKNKIKTLLMVTLLGSIFTSHYISYRWGEELELSHYKSLSSDETVNQTADQPEPKSKAQKLFELLPLKCRLGDRATFAVGMYKEQPMYALKFEHPKDLRTEYLQLKRNQIRGRGYELVARDLKTHLNVSVDYEVTASNQFYITLNWVKYITDKRSYGSEPVICSS